MNKFAITKLVRTSTVCTLSLLLFAGCGGDDGLPERGDVEGIITLDGAPLPNVMIMFNPVNGGGRAAMGMSDENGWYRLVYNSTTTGTLVGMNAVQLEKPEFEAEDLEEMMAAEGESEGEAAENPMEMINKIPNKYFGEFMEIDIKPGDNEVNIDLASGGSDAEE